MFNTNNLPALIIISSSTEKHEDFIETFITKNNIHAYSIFKIKAEKEEIGINQVREVKKQLITTAKEVRLFIFYSFDNSSYEAQNALLKIIEDDIINNKFIFLVKNSEKILPTIHSRSIKINLDENKKYIPNGKIISLIESIEKDQNYSFLGNESVTNQSKSEVLTIFDELIYYYKQRLKENNNSIPKILKKIMTLKTLVEQNNLSPGLTLDCVLIFIKKNSILK